MSISNKILSKYIKFLEFFSLYCHYLLRNLKELFKTNKSYDLIKYKSKIEKSKFCLKKISNKNLNPTVNPYQDIYDNINYSYDEPKEINQTTFDDS